MTTTVTLNGDDRPVPDGTTVGQLLDEVVADRRGVAVALDGEVVPRGRWDDTALTDGVRVELVGAAQGG